MPPRSGNRNCFNTSGRGCLTNKHNGVADRNTSTKICAPERVRDVLPRKQTPWMHGDKTTFFLERDKSRLASVCAPRVASWCPCTFLFVKTARLPRGHARKFRVCVEKRWRRLPPFSQRDLPRGRDLHQQETANCDFACKKKKPLSHDWLAMRRSCSATCTMAASPTEIVLLSFSCTTSAHATEQRLSASAGRGGHRTPWLSLRGSRPCLCACPQSQLLVQLDG